VVSTPVFIAVDVASVDMTADDRVLANAIVAAGAEAIPVIWGAPLPRPATLVIRSTWDYVDGRTRTLLSLRAPRRHAHGPAAYYRLASLRRQRVGRAGSLMPGGRVRSLDLCS